MNLIFWWLHQTCTGNDFFSLINNFNTHLKKTQWPASQDSVADQYSRQFPWSRSCTVSLWRRPGPSTRVYNRNNLHPPARWYLALSHKTPVYEELGYFEIVNCSNQMNKKTDWLAFVGNKSIYLWGICKSVWWDVVFTCSARISFVAKLNNMFVRKLFVF